MLSADFGETIKNFFATGNNLYIVIAVAVAIVALIVIIVVSAPKNKKKKSASDKSAESSESVSETESETIEESEHADVAAVTADSENKSPEKESVVCEKDTEKTDSETKSEAEKTSTDGERSDKDKTPERAAKNAETKSAVKKEKEPKSTGKDGTESERAETPVKPSDTKKAETPEKSSDTKKETSAKPSDTKKAEKSAKAEDETAASSAAVEILDDEAYDSESEPSEEDGKETRPGTVEIYKDARGEFHFRFRSVNGSIVGHSQAYKSKDGCKNGIRSVVSCCEDVIIADTTKKDSDYVQTIGRAAFEIYRDNAGQFRYRLVAKNASNVLASQGYTNKTNCIKGAESIIRMSKNHVIEDETLKRKPKDAE